MKKAIVLLAVFIPVLLGFSAVKGHAAINDYGSASFISARINNGTALEFVHVGRYKLLDQVLWAEKAVLDVIEYDVIVEDNIRVAVIH